MPERNCSHSSFTVYFDPPFWVGVYQRQEAGRLALCKVTFGAEPKDYEVYDFLLRRWHTLVFAQTDTPGEIEHGITNPKRAQRAIGRSLRQTGVGTRAQQAMQQARQAGKQARKTQTRLQKQAEQERRYALRVQKKKEKHRGR